MVAWSSPTLRRRSSSWLDAGSQPGLLGRSRRGRAKGVTAVQSAGPDGYRPTDRLGRRVGRRRMGTMREELACHVHPVQGDAVCPEHRADDISRASREPCRPQLEHRPPCEAVSPAELRHLRTERPPRLSSWFFRSGRHRVPRCVSVRCVSCCALVLDVHDQGPSVSLILTTVSRHRPRMQRIVALCRASLQIGWRLWGKKTWVRTEPSASGSSC